MKLEINPRIITEVIGKGQYSQFRSVLAEYIANAWDAEAGQVSITIPDDFTTDPIVIFDDGKGILESKFIRVGFNIQTENTTTSTYRRPIMGMKGIGRFSGFAFAESIKYESNNGIEQVTCEFNREELLKHKDITSIDIPSNIIQVTTPSTWTKVTLSCIDQQYNIPTVDQVIRDIVLDFGVISDFIIEVNGRRCESTPIDGEQIVLDEINPVFGHVSGIIRISKIQSKKMKAGIIIRVRNRRVEGPTFFGLDEAYSAKVINRIYGDVNADGLQDIISSGREAFIQHDDGYIELVEYLKEKILIAIQKIESETVQSIEEIIYSLPKFKQRLNKIPAHLQSTCNIQIKKIAPRLSRIKNDRDLLEIISILVLRAVENADVYTVLNELEQTSNTDISALADIFEKWGIGEITQTFNLLRSRMEILFRFTEIVNDKEALELQDIHKILESNTWILDDRYSLFTSNKGLRNIAEKMGKEYTGSSGRDRPDLILKRDKDDFVIIELKAPSVEVSFIEVGQALKYRTELRTMIPEARDIDVYIIGKGYDTTSRDNFPTGNAQRVHLTSLDQILQEANSRLLWLSGAFQEEVVEYQESIISPEKVSIV